MLCLNLLDILFSFKSSALCSRFISGVPPLKKTTQPFLFELRCIHAGLGNKQHLWRLSPVVDTLFLLYCRLGFIRV